MKTLVRSRWNSRVVLGAPRHNVLIIALIFLSGGDVSLAASPIDNRSVAVDEATGLRAFGEVASVLRSPRCINCHPSGDVPRQTDQQMPHFPPVARGADGRGITGMRCSACHQAENQSNGIPGAPHWGLAPRSMAWVGLNDHDLAEQLKDSNRNGHRTLEQMIDHVVSERLVLWAWQPGGSRAAPPLTHEQFVQRFQDWVAAGAPSPQSGKK